MGDRVGGWVRGGDDRFTKLYAIYETPKVLGEGLLLV